MAISGRAATRRRNTVQFDDAQLQRCLDEAVALERRRIDAGAPRFTEPAAAPATAGRRAVAAQGQSVREQLLALLKAFCDAAQPAGGLKLDAANEPAELPQLLEAGRRNARAGDCLPKALDKVRAGRAIDLRIAVALLHAFRLLLERPALTLAALGGTESERLRTVRRLERALGAARDDLPQAVFEALRLRADETATYSYMIHDAQVQYRWVGEETGADGVRRLRVQRSIRYTPLRLHAFPARLAPSQSYEWYQWSQLAQVRLRLHVAPAPGRRRRSVELPLVRRLLPGQGVFRVEVDPRADASLQAMLVVDGSGAGERQPVLEWQEEMLFNIADRDILVWYQPVHGLSISADGALLSRLHFAVGDSPGLQPTAAGWQLDRALMPREVVAVRFWRRDLDDDAVLRFTPGGALRVAGEPAPAPARRPRPLSPA